MEPTGSRAGKPRSYSGLLSEIKERIRSAQYAALDVGSFSMQNLWCMRQFYSEYYGNEKLQPLVGEIAWSHNLAIMNRSLFR